MENWIVLYFQFSLHHYIYCSLKGCEIVLFELGSGRAKFFKLVRLQWGNLISLGVQSKMYKTHTVGDDIDDSSNSSDIFICSVTLLSGKRVLLGPAQVGVAISGFAQTQPVAKRGERRT